MYTYSLFICLADSMSTPGTVATGTVMRPETLRRYARQAGLPRRGCPPHPRVRDVPVLRPRAVRPAPPLPAPPVALGVGAAERDCAGATLKPVGGAHAPHAAHPRFPVARRARSVSRPISSIEVPREAEGDVEFGEDVAHDLGDAGLAGDAEP